MYLYKNITIYIWRILICPMLTMENVSAMRTYSKEWGGWIMMFKQTGLIHTANDPCNSCNDPWDNYLAIDNPYNHDTCIKSTDRNWLTCKYHIYISENQGRPEELKGMDRVFFYGLYCSQENCSCNWTCDQKGCYCGTQSCGCDCT